MGFDSGCSSMHNPARCAGLVSSGSSVLICLALISFMIFVRFSARLRIKERLMLLPIYYTFFIACTGYNLLTCVYWAWISIRDINPTKNSNPIAVTLNVLIFFTQFFMEESVAFYLIQRKGGRTAIRKAGIAAFFWALLPAVLDAIEASISQVLYSILWVSIYFTLFSFYLWIAMTRYSSRLRFRRTFLHPRTSLFAYAVTLVVYYGLLVSAWTVAFYVYIKYPGENSASDLEALSDPRAKIVGMMRSTTGQILLGEIYAVGYTIVLTSTLISDTMFWRTLGRGSKILQKRLQLDSQMRRLLDSWHIQEEDIEDSSLDSISNLVIDFSRISMGTKIGSGATALIRKGTYTPTVGKQQEIAVKQFWQMGLDPTEIMDFLREAVLTSQMSHQNIVKMMGVCVRPPDLCLVLEYCEKGSLYTILHKSNIQLLEGDKLRMCFECTAGVEYLHRQNLIHRDIKSMNYLVSRNWEVKLGDFGQSRSLGSQRELSRNKGTILWNAPEVLMEKLYNEKADVYSLAMVFWEILTQEEPFLNSNLLDIFNDICVRKTRPVIPAHVDEELQALMNKMWEHEDYNRPSSTEVIAALSSIQKRLQNSGRLKLSLK